MEKNKKTFFDGKSADFRQIIESVLSYLPMELAAEIRMTLSSHPEGWEGLGEIRLRREAPSTLTVWGRTAPLSFRFETSSFRQLVERLCEGSLYAHREQIRRGYLSLGHGVRVGVAGYAVREGDSTQGVSEFTSLVFRIPHSAPGAGEAVLAAYRAGGGKRGILLWAPPGEGKTTALRDFVNRLAVGRGPSVAVVDTRDEFQGTLDRGCHADLLLGYSRAEGIRIALCTLSPALIVCDEIGGAEEARAIEEAGLSGVPLVASVHGRSAEEVVRLPHLRGLFKRGLFGYLVGIRRRGRAFIGETVTWEEVRL